MTRPEQSLSYRLANKTDACFIIGEIGVNHNGSLDLARDLIDVAVKAGADAVKFQTFDAAKLVTRSAAKAKYQKDNDGNQGSQYDMLKRLELSESDLRACKAYCDENNIIFLSTPFDEQAADLLHNVGVNGFKVSSGDLTNIPMLEHIAAKNLPIIISTGMANLAEVEEAVSTIQSTSDAPLAILHCISNYPANPAEANLRAMDTLHQAFGCPVGWSDHTLGDEVSIAAVARGARIIEKHYTLDVNLPGPDHKASLEPEAFADMVRKIRNVSKALGNGIKTPQPSEMETADVARRSIVSARDIKAGEIISQHDLICKRPGTGLKPNMMQYIVGQEATRDIEADSLLSLNDVR